MIKSLSISNYALIKHIELTLDPRFNVITGETGAGKSIIMGALGLLQGRRSDSRNIPTANGKSVVEAEFSLNESTKSTIDRLLADEGHEPCDGTALVLRREIAPTGRSKALLNGSPISLSTMREIADLLVDIHSQHNNLNLADSDFQLAYLDNLANNHTLLAEYQDVYSQYRKALKRFADLRDAIDATRADADYLQYRYEKLQSANLLPGEDRDLEEQRRRLESSSTVAEQILAATDALSGNEMNAVSAIDRAIDALSAVADSSDERAALLARLESLRIELNDIASSVSDEAESLAHDPNELEQIISRLESLYYLMAKHKAASVDELIELRDSLAQRLGELANADEVLGDAKAAAVELKRKALALAAQLTESRSQAARMLETRLPELAIPLGLKNLAFEIKIESGKLNPMGADKVDFLFAFNKNQVPTVIANTASGGEISRIMLVLKSILAAYTHLPTIIYDEIDTGVSGDVASRMGRLMADTGRHMQVIAITHLPQVAARGDAHFKVYKQDDEESTSTYIQHLGADDRRHEIAVMLSGSPDEPAALANADSLLSID